MLQKITEWKTYLQFENDYNKVKFLRKIETIQIIIRLVNDTKN